MIKDDGIGIEKCNLPFIGYPEISIGKMNVRQSIGFSTAIQVIKDWGESLEFNSEPSTGTQVSISLPKN